MPKSATLTIRLDPKLKSEAEQVLSDLGLTPSLAITLFLQQVIYQRGLPFEIRLPDEPNEATVRVIKESLIEPSLTRAKNADELFEDLDK